MPGVLFSFKCLLGHQFDGFSPIGVTPDSRPCPQCGHTASRVLTAPALSFPGGTNAGYIKR